MKTRDIPIKIYAAGLSLIEIMVSLAIGSILMLGLVSSFKTSSDAQRELERAGMLIENGRYAINLLTDDLRHAGFFGYYFDLSNPPAALQDPCALTTTSLSTALGMPLQGYTAADLSSVPDISATTCGSGNQDLLTPANLSPGSDIVVVRRADTEVFTGNPDSKVIYIQANNQTIDVQVGNPSAYVDGALKVAQTADYVFQLFLASPLKKYPKVDTGGFWIPGLSDYADTRKYRVHVYFVAPCSVGTGTEGVCQPGDDDIPTLKRLELTSIDTDNDGEPDTTAMEIVPLVEGIEYLKMEYGIDTSPTTINTVTGLVGDSIPDSYIPAPTAAQWPTVVTARVNILARYTAETVGYTDAKSYTLGPASGTSTIIPATNDAFKRHVFSAEVRPMNLAGRREIPE